MKKEFCRNIGFFFLWKLNDIISQKSANIDGKQYQN